MRLRQPLSVSLPFLLAPFSSASVLLRRSDPFTTSIGGLRANGGSIVDYVLSGTTWDPTNPWNGTPIISLNPPALGDPQSFTYAVENGVIDAKSPNGEVSWGVPEQTGPVTLRELVNGSKGFTYVDGELRYQGSGDLWWGCTSKQTGGVLVLYAQIETTVPGDGQCTKVRITGAQEKNEQR